MTNTRAWLLAFRLKTLTAALVPVTVATSLVLALGDFYQYWVSGFALVSAFCIQVATNLLNDAIDFKKGADDDQRLGPQRVTQSGLLSDRQVYALAIIFLILATVLALPLVVRGGWPIVGLGVISLFLAYGYTGGPFPLAYLGLGDLFVILFFGLFAVGGTAYLHGLSYDTVYFVAGLQMGFLSTTLIAINNLRDSDTDKMVGKKTLAVRFGDSFVRWEIVSLLILTYLLSLYYVVKLQYLYTLLTFALLPFAVFLSGLIFSVQDKKHLNKALGFAALHQLLFAALLSLGFLV